MFLVYGKVQQPGQCPTGVQHRVTGCDQILAELDRSAGGEDDVALLVMAAT